MFLFYSWHIQNILYSCLQNKTINKIFYNLLTGITEKNMDLKFND